MNRLFAPRREQRTEKQSSGSPRSDDGGSLRGLIRKALLGIAVIGAAYVVSRRLRAGDPAQAANARYRESRDAGPHDVRPSEGRKTFDHEQAQQSVGEQTDDSRPAADEKDAVSDDLPGEDRSAEEIEERAVDDAHEEPAEPGEMTVDEDVVEDVVDGDVETETDEEDESETGDGQALE